jgi:hypothetical protein
MHAYILFSCWVHKGPASQWIVLTVTGLLVCVSISKLEEIFVGFFAPQRFLSYLPE